MKFDMHCHTKEGSLDGKVSIEDYIKKLRDMGFGGMLVTDHNSYNGYRYWKKHIKGKKYTDFVVLKGIEYDTLDAGHIIVIMPENLKLKILEFRGMPVQMLIDVVHRYGGVLGPAHPCGEKYMSITNTRRYRRRKDIIKQFDFLESYNSCESPEVNQAAAMLSQIYKIPGFGGSDSHKEACIGTAYTEFPVPIAHESDIIRFVHGQNSVKTGGDYYHGTTKERLGRVNSVLVYSFWFYNKLGALYKYRKRKNQLKRKELHEEIRPVGK